MFSSQLEQSLNQAFYHAREKGHEFITVEHLLLALSDDVTISDLLTQCGGNVERLHAGLEIFINETTPKLPSGQAKRDIQPTLSFQRVLQRAIYQVQMSSGQLVESINVLLAIYAEPDSQAVYFLNQENISIQELMLTLHHPNHEPDESTHMDDNFDDHQAGFDQTSSFQSDMSFQQPETPTETDENLIEQFTTNLNKRAQLDKIDPLIGRKSELKRVEQILCRRSKNNPLLVGDAGVGKTAIAQSLAQAIVDKKVPKILLNYTVYALDLGVLVAGTKYRGDFEKRFKMVLNELGKDKKAIIFIDEIHNLVGAGSATGGTMDAANLIKPLLSSGDILCMGATTYDEYRNFFSKDSALLRRFQKIDIKEPGKLSTLKILKGLKSKYESHHGVFYTNAALKRAVELSMKYMMDRNLPDKAIDVIDEAGALQHLKNKTITNDQKVIVDSPEIDQVVASITKTPIDKITESERSNVLSLGKRLKKMVFGQDSAVKKLVQAIHLSRAGLKDERKPIGSFLMAGPTGVGKTELSIQLAKNLGVELIRLDMSEYMEKHTVSRLVGAPPGYVGHDQGGVLTEKVLKNPHSVVLLDEIEKAHPDLFNILLQVMDYGHLTDSNGREIDFRHTIIIMTTNVGAEEMEKSVIGFTGDQSSNDSGQAIKQLFSPEFRNRLDAILPFKHLNEEIISQVIEKNLAELATRLKRKNIILKVSSSAKDWIANKGYDKKMGARPMQRVIQEYCKQPLAESILFDEDSLKKNVKIDVRDNELVVDHVED